MSNKFGNYQIQDIDSYLFTHFRFVFGYDNSSETYKVVMLMMDEARNKTHVQVLSDNVWKTIPDFPAVPLPCLYDGPGGSDGVYLNDCLNWLAIHNHPVCIYGWKNTKAKEFVIVSLDMRTESYTQLMPLLEY